jgi:hypothetical protein
VAGVNREEGKMISKSTAAKILKTIQNDTKMRALSNKALGLIVIQEVWANLEMDSQGASAIDELLRRLGAEPEDKPKEERSVVDSWRDVAKKTTHGDTGISG